MLSAVPLLPLLLLSGVSSASSVPYLLGRESTFERGCFDPCDCPIQEAGIRGSFLLTFAGSDPLFDNYLVSNVRWKVPALDLLITGEGTYRIGGEFALEEQLVLDLSIDGGPVQRFDSGRDIGPSAFPGFDIAVSMNGGVCFDTVIHVRARPAIDVRASTVSLAWGPIASGDRSDLLQGDLSGLRMAGSLGASARACLANDAPMEEIDLALLPDPPVGSGHWFLIRAEGRGGSWDSDSAMQAAPRDFDLAAGAASCP